MKKPVFIGAGLGLLVLVAVAGVLWITGQFESVAPVLSPPLANHRAMPQAGVATVPPTIVANSAAQESSRQANQEHRRRLAEVRAEFNALRTQGMQAPPEKIRAVVDELESLSPSFDPRYFQALRNMLDASAKVQALSNELQALNKGNAPKDMARQEVILKEMRALGESVRVEAQRLQDYAPTAEPKAKTP